MTALDPDITGQLVADLAPEDLAVILQAFRGDVTRLVAELQAAAGQGDADGYLRAAHSLAGAAAAIGATQLEQLARLAMVPGALPQAGAVLPRLAPVATATLAELAALIPARA